jgi:hypothetical protein
MTKVQIRIPELKSGFLTSNPTKSKTKTQIQTTKPKTDDQNTNPNAKAPFRQINKNLTYNIYQASPILLKIPENFSIILI